MSVVRNYRRRKFAALADLRGIFQIFNGIEVALSTRGDKSNDNDQATVQARTTTTQSWSSI